MKSTEIYNAGQVGSKVNVNPCIDILPKALKTIHSTTKNPHQDSIPFRLSNISL